MMAFGIDRKELNAWKKQVLHGEVTFLTHYWLDGRFPECDTVTKVGCADIIMLLAWGKQYGLKRQWIHNRDHYPHFDLFGEIQRHILINEQKWSHLIKFDIL